MGFDTSHHPVDVSLIQDRLIPYILEGTPIDDLVERAVRLERVRFRANAWGLGLAEWCRERGGPAAFDTSLLVWGRPFFVTPDAPDALSASIDRYLGARPEAVDAIAAEMLRHLDPDLVGKITPSTGGNLPDPVALASGVRRNLDLLRDAYRNLESNTPVRLPGGETAAPDELLAREVPLAVLSFAAQLRPGWMDRGNVWPTRLLEEIGVDSADLFEPPRALLGRLAEEADLDYFLAPTIVENYMVGGYVPKEKMAALRERLERHRQRLVLAFDEGGEPEPEMVFSVRKLLEAVGDAERRGLAFAEATEIYSGFMGVMN